MKCTTSKKLEYIFKKDQEIIDHSDRELLNLTGSLRTHLAGDVSEFVNNFVDGKISKATNLVKKIYQTGFTMLVTRDIEIAKKYCIDRYEGNLEKRYGLLASSKATGLTCYGVNNTYYGTKNTDFGKWFNTPRGS